MRRRSSGMDVQRLTMSCLFERTAWVNCVAHDVPDAETSLSDEWEAARRRLFARADNRVHVTDYDVHPRLVPELVYGYECILDGGYASNVAYKKLTPRAVSILRADGQVPHADATVHFVVDPFHGVAASTSIDKVPFDRMHVPYAATIHDKRQCDSKH